MATAQTQAISNANIYISLAQQLVAWYVAATAANNAWNDDGSLAIVQALATAPQNTDGSLGTADGTPNNAHPIDTRVTANAALSRAVSANSLTSAITQVNAIVGFLNGSQAGPTAGVRAVLNQLTGG